MGFVSACAPSTQFCPELDLVVAWAVLGKELDLKVLKVFSYLNGSVIPQSPSVWDPGEALG